MKELLERVTIEELDWKKALATGLIGATFALGTPSFASSVVIDMKKLAWIESSNNPRAVSYKGAKYGRGLYQVSEKVLKEWNDFHPHEKYTPEDLFDPEINRKIATWYLYVRIPYMLRRYKVPDTVEHRLIAYNWGIGHLVDWYRAGADYNKLPKETRDFLKKYAGNS